MKDRESKTQRRLLAALQAIHGHVATRSSGKGDEDASVVGLRRGEDGQAMVYTVILAAFFAVILAGLALDVGILFHEKRVAQSAADAAAVAAAGEYATDGSLDANAQNAANAAAKANGISATPALSTVSSGNYSNANGGKVPSVWVKAQVAQSIPTYFMRALGSKYSSVTVGASAFAAASQTVATCICLEGGGWDLSVNNNAQLNGSQCAVTADSSPSTSNPITIAGSGNICTQSIAAQSSWYNSTNVPSLGYEQNGNVCPSTKVVQNSTTTCAPPPPPAPAATTCISDPIPNGGGAAYAVGPGASGNSCSGSSSTGTVCYNSLTIGNNNDTVTLCPGTYIINGGTLEFESGRQLGGQGVFFYFQQGIGGPYSGQYPSMEIANDAQVNLTAGGATESDGSTTAPSVGSSSSPSQYNGYLFDYAANVPCTMTGSVYSTTFTTAYPVNVNNGSSGVTGTSTNTAPLTFQGGSNSYLGGEIYAPSTCISIGNGSSAGVFDGDIVAQELLMDGGTTLNLTPNSNMGNTGASGASLTQ